MHDYPLAHYPHSRIHTYDVRSALCDVDSTRWPYAWSNTTTSDAIDTYPSKSPLHARERLQQLSVSPSLIPPSIPAISFWKRRVVDSFPLLLLSFPVTKLAYPLPHQPSFSTTIRSCLFDFPSNSSSYRFFPPLATNPFFESLPSLTSDLEN